MGEYLTSESYGKVKFYKKKWFKAVLAVFLVLVLALGVIAWKAGITLNKISTKMGILENLIHALPMVKNKLAGEDEGRVNILLLGMRGENMEGGGLLADTIMIASIKPQENKISLVSIPRDFYADVPGRGFKSKINAVYHYGEEQKKGQGLEDMRKVAEDIAGVPIHYAASINFKGFSDLVNSLGGIEIHLDQPFIEPLQFKEEHVCDSNVFTVPSGNYQTKKNEKGKVVAAYPLCYNKNLECGGIFQLPAGNITLTGEQALCYVRSRVTSSDFDRAKRQQIVLQEIKEKSLKIGTLTDFEKVNGMFESLGNNARTDMQLWEMKRLFELYKGINEPQVVQKVLENSEEGLLYVPENAPPEAGYILLPRGDNYNRIRELFNNILN